MPLKQGAAKREKLARLFQSGEFASWGNEGERDDIGDRQSAVGSQVVQNAREELADDILTRWQQRMRVMRLWDAFAVLRGHWEDVTVNNGDLLKVIRQDASGEQPGHAASNYQGMTTYVLLYSSAR
jgi:hypothetical protein